MKESALADSFQYLQNCADLFCEQGEASSGLCPNVGRSLPVSVSGTISARRKFCPNVDCSLLVNPDRSSIKKRRPAAPSPTKNQLPQSLMTDLGLTKTNIYYEECGLRVYLRYVTEFESRKTVQTESRTKPIGLSLLSSEHRLRLSIAETSFVSAFDLHCFWPRCSLFSVKPKKRSRLLIMTYRPLLAYSNVLISKMTTTIMPASDMTMMGTRFLEMKFLG